MDVEVDETIVPADEQDAVEEKPDLDEAPASPPPTAKTKKKKVKVLQLTKDQSARAGQVHPLRSACKNQHPVLILVDKRYALFPYDCGEKMHVVLGWYWIRDLWGELCS